MLKMRKTLKICTQSNYIFAELLPTTRELRVIRLHPSPKRNSSLDFNPPKFKRPNSVISSKIARAFPLRHEANATDFE